MFKLNQRGALNVLLFPLIAVILLLIGAGAFGIWAYGQRQDYKDHSDQKSQEAVTAALKVEDAKKDAQFAEASKYPLKTYNGPSNYGSLHVSYPKTWSAYVDETGSSGNALDAYFYPDFVPAISDAANSYALRVEVLNQAYSDTLQNLTDDVQNGRITLAPYSLPKVSKVIGSRVEGHISDTKTGTLIIMPLRDKTLEVWTEASQFSTDFNDNVLPNLIFSP